MAVKKKKSDRDMKEFFGDYARAKGRCKALIAKTHSRPLTTEEQQEYKKLQTYMKVIDEMINCLEPTLAKIIREYYIEHNTLVNLGVELNYCYEHVSYLKILGCDNLKTIITGNKLIQSKYSLSLLDIVNKVCEGEAE